MNIIAHHDVVKDICDHLVAAYEEYLILHQDDNNGEGISYLDGFMIDKRFTILTTLIMKEGINNENQAN